MRKEKQRTYLCSKTKKVVTPSTNEEVKNNKAARETIETNHVEHSHGNKEADIKPEQTNTIKETKETNDVKQRMNEGNNLLFFSKHDQSKCEQEQQHIHVTN